MNLSEIRSQIDNFNNKFSRLEGERDMLNGIAIKQKDAIESFNEQIKKNSETSQFLQKLANMRHNKIKQKIENSASIGLQSIFENDKIRFVIQTEEKRNAISSSFKIADDNLGLELDPKYAFGGSLIDVISIVMRILFNELSLPKVEGPIILDEVGKFIDVEYQKNFIIFLRKVTEQISRQVILVTHFQTYMEKAHRLIKIENKNGRSEAIYQEIEKED